MGYGVWLVIEDDNWIKTTHTPHVTVACYMTFEDANVHTRILLKLCSHRFYIRCM